MDQRIEHFLADVLALAGEDPDATSPLTRKLTSQIRSKCAHLSFL